MSIVDMKVALCDKNIVDCGRRLTVEEWIEMLDQLTERLHGMRNAAMADLGGSVVRRGDL